MADLDVLQEIANRGLQDQLPDEQRVAFDTLLSRNVITSVATPIASPAPASSPTLPKGTGVVDRIRATGEVAATFATGAVALPVAGISGIIEGVSSFVSGDDLESAGRAMAERAEELSRSMTFQPRTETGKGLLSAVSAPFEKFGELTKGAGDVVQEKSLDALGPEGSAALGTAVSTGLEFLPSIAGVKKPPFKARRGDVKAVETAAKDIGLDLKATTPKQRGQIIESAQQQSGGRTSLGEGFENIQAAVEKARTTEKTRVDQLYADARSTDAGVLVTEVRDFSKTVKEALSDFDTQDMPIVKRRLAEIDEITKLPDNAVVKLNAVAKFRQRINKNTPSGADRPQQAALGIIKGKLDSFLDNQFNAEMITGNPIAVQKWKAANEAFKQFKQTFDDNKTVNQLATQKATSVEVRNWIVGASELGLKKEAASVVARIKKIVGEDSASMTALRQDVLYGIVEPLLAEVPNFKKFTANYDKIWRKNKPLMQELFPESVNALSELRSFAGSIDQIKNAKIDIDLNRAAAVTLFGHQMAKKALTVNVAKNLFAIMRQVTGRGNKKKIMTDVLGYNPNASLLPIEPAITQSVIQTGINREQQ